MPGGELTPIATAVPGRVVKKELRVDGSILGNRLDAVEVVDLVARGFVNVHYEVRRMDQVTEVSMVVTKLPILY